MIRRSLFLLLIPAFFVHGGRLAKVSVEPAAETPVVRWHMPEISGAPIAVGYNALAKGNHVLPVNGIPPISVIGKDFLLIGSLKTAKPRSEIQFNVFRTNLKPISQFRLAWAFDEPLPQFLPAGKNIRQINVSGAIIERDFSGNTVSEHLPPKAIAHNSENSLFILKDPMAGKLFIIRNYLPAEKNGFSCRSDVSVLNTENGRYEFLAEFDGWQSRNAAQFKFRDELLISQVRVDVESGTVQKRIVAMDESGAVKNQLTGNFIYSAVSLKTIWLAAKERLFKLNENRLKEVWRTARGEQILKIISAGEESGLVLLCGRINPEAFNNQQQWSFTGLRLLLFSANEEPEVYPLPADYMVVEPFLEYVESSNEILFGHSAGLERFKIK